jgi:hypothetical protein
MFTAWYELNLYMEINGIIEKGSISRPTNSCLGGEKVTNI